LTEFDAGLEGSGFDICSILLLEIVEVLMVLELLALASLIIA
jgi:hypothetical protein